ncbi:amino acid permease-domain-containing protein [Xylogone sp. PMI_703]|nr:amino acid permease-domain-containing protein [Xylogone sp. PMI_703]
MLTNLKHEDIGESCETEVRDAEVSSHNQLARKLKSRHMQMIAIGGSIGGGLFIGSGSALYTGGPGSLVIDFMIIGVMLYPVNGSFYAYSVRFIDPGWGFAMGWNYAMSYLAVLPFELSAAVFLVFVTVINIFGVKPYGEVEFILGLVKVIAVVGFIITAIVIDTGGVPTDKRGYIGARYWHSPEQAFKNGFQGFCSVFVTAAFAFGGTELVGLASAEAANPRKSIPKATKQVFWRITLFFVLSLFLLGLILPSSDPNLAKASGTRTAYSPFVRSFEYAGITVLPSRFNAVIMISIISVGTACTYGSTRTIQALAQNGMAPRSICAAHIRFRWAWKHSGRSVDDLPFQSMFGVIGSWIGLAMNILRLIATFYISLYPVGGPHLNIKIFLENYLAAPVVLLLFVGYKLTMREWKMGVDLKNVDLDFYRRTED